MENVSMIRSGYSSRTFEIKSVPIPAPVPPPREWQSWKPCRPELSLRPITKNVYNCLILPSPTLHVLTRLDCGEPATPTQQGTKNERQKRTWYLGNMCVPFLPVTLPFPPPRKPKEKTCWQSVFLRVCITLTSQEQGCTYLTASRQSQPSASFLTTSRTES